MKGNFVYIILGAGLVLGPIIFIGLVYSDTAFCHSFFLTQRTVPPGITSNSVKSPDGLQVATIQQEESYYRPIGLCTFPDGGMPRYVTNQLKILIAPVALPSQTKLLTKIDLPVEEKIRYPEIIDWDKKNVIHITYSHLSGYEPYIWPVNYSIDATSGNATKDASPVNYPTDETGIKIIRH